MAPKLTPLMGCVFSGESSSCAHWLHQSAGSSSSSSQQSALGSHLPEGRAPLAPALAQAHSAVAPSDVSTSGTADCVVNRTQHGNRDKVGRSLTPAEVGITSPLPSSRPFIGSCMCNLCTAPERGYFSIIESQNITSTW